MKSFTTLTTTATNLSQNTSTANTALMAQLINDSLRYLTTKFFFDEKTYNTVTVAQQQFYNMPPQWKILVNLTVNIGSVLWLPKVCPNRDYWDSLNVIQFYQDFPSFYFIWNNQVGIFPTPASSGNTIAMNYKVRLTDLSQADYTTGTVSVTTNTTTVTGSGTSWTTSMAGRWIQITENSTSNTTSGDENWYQIDSVTNATTLVLKGKYTGATVSGGAYTIGEMPILAEDYHDLAMYRALWIYFTSIVPDATRAKMYKEMYDIGYEVLNSQFGSKTTSVVLTDTDAPVYNPNLFVSSQAQI